jgi:hypothetical protein
VGCNVGWYNKLPPAALFWLGKRIETENQVDDPLVWELDAAVLEPHAKGCLFRIVVHKLMRGIYSCKTAIFAGLNITRLISDLGR